MERKYLLAGSEILIAALLVVGGFLYFRYHKPAQVSQHVQEYDSVKNKEKIPEQFMRFLIVGSEPDVVKGERDVRGDQVAYSMGFTTTSHSNEVSDQYTKLFQESGYTIDAKTNTDGQYSLVASRYLSAPKSTQHITVQINPTAQGSRVDVVSVGPDMTPLAE